MHPEVKVIVDTGFQGLEKLHKKTYLPKKISKKCPLTLDEKMVTE